MGLDGEIVTYVHLIIISSDRYVTYECCQWHQIYLSFMFFHLCPHFLTSAFPSSLDPVPISNLSPLICAKMIYMYFSLFPTCKAPEFYMPPTLTVYGNEGFIQMKKSQLLSLMNEIFLCGKLTSPNITVSERN